MNAIILYVVAVLLALLGFGCWHRGYRTGYREGQAEARTVATRRFQRDGKLWFHKDYSRN